VHRVFPIAPSAHHEALKPEIVRVFNETFAVYGANKVWHQMQQEAETSSNSHERPGSDG
jgi:hypothetical protein